MAELEQKLKKDGTPDKRFRKKKLDSLNPTRIEAQIKEFFDTNDPLDWSVPRLCIHLHMTKYMFNKMKDDPTFASVYDYATNMIESALFRDLKTMKNPTGAIFALKTMGYSDRRGLDIQMAGKVTVEQLLKDGKLKA